MLARWQQDADLIVNTLLSIIQVSRWLNWAGRQRRHLANAYSGADTRVDLRRSQAVGVQN